MIMNGKKRIRLSHTFVLYSTAINGNLDTKFLKIGQGLDVLGVQAKITNFDRLEWVLFAYITCIYFKILDFMFPIGPIIDIFGIIV